MIQLHYFNESGIRINYEVLDWEAVHAVADGLFKAPIDLLEIYYQDGINQGIFSLETFTTI